MIYIVILATILLLTMLVLVYASKAHNAIKVVAGTVIILMYAFSYSYYIDNLGLPKNEFPSEDFIYIYHENTTDSKTLLWAVMVEDQTHRLFQFDYDRETAKKLEQAKQAKENGKMMRGEITSDSSSGSLMLGFELDEYRPERDEHRKNQDTD